MQNQHESDIQREILNAISRGRLRAWRQQAGQVFVVPFKEAQRKGVRGHFMELAPAGAADLTGIYDDGRRVEIEVKSASGAQRPEQRAWESMIRSRGGVYILARSVDEALAHLGEARVVL